VAGQDLARRDPAPPGGRLPARLVAGQLDLGEHAVDHAVEQVDLVGDVVVQRHRLDPQLHPELAHGERVEPAGVGERDGRPQDLVPVQPAPRVAHPLPSLDVLTS
jgi:hypothetical protein